MRSFKMAASLAVLCASVAFGAASAGAAEMASLSSCINLEDQVKAALASKTQSPNYTEAQRERISARTFCTSGFYKNGVDHYNQALKLLGVGQS